MENKVILITGGAGFLGSNFCHYIVEKKINVKKVIVFSRDWLKQKKLKDSIGENDKFRFFIGDVRDKQRLIRAMHGVDIVIHAAAIKDLESCEYNPSEAMLTNVVGTQNVIDSCIANKVSNSILISTDKAFKPINIYGASKFMAEGLFIQANKYSATDEIRFSVCRYGNVFGSSGSVLEVWQSLLKNGAQRVPITHMEMTRFFINVEDTVKFIIESINWKLPGGKIFIPNLKSFSIRDLARALNKGYVITGIKQGEKLHEELQEGYTSQIAERMRIDELEEEVKRICKKLK
jgi:UDP-N-acetylglucosamine 4,6-dehydratase